ncbi:MAG: DivIVA domain-containing protein [Actinomycetota bacterium]
MPLTPEEIKGQRFPVNLRGYEKEHVDEFLARVAGDYEAAIAAIASAADPYGSLGNEVSSVLRTAKESAERLRRETEDEVKSLRYRATEEVSEIQRQASEEAAGTLEQAREKAVRLTHEAERHLREANDEAQSLKQRTSDEAVEIRRQAAEEAATTLDAATDRAERLMQEAQRRSRELHESTERQCDDMLKGATVRNEQLLAHERELHERVDAVDQALSRLRAELRSGESLGSKSIATEASPVVADRLRALEPGLDQVASALVDNERPEDVLSVQEVSDREKAPSARAE